MTDLLFVALLSAFFVLAALFVRVCDRIIGPPEKEQGATTVDRMAEDRTAA